MLKRPKPLEWSEKQYQIYALIDPRDEVIRYIGMSGDTQFRYYQHLIDSKGGWRLKEWINELKQLGLTPKLQILETIDSLDNPRIVAREREHYWIDYFTSRDVPLLNAFGVIRPYNRGGKAVKAGLWWRNRQGHMTEFARLRINAGLTIVQLANEADVARGTIEKIEKGQPVRAVLAARACNALSKHLQHPVTYESLGIPVI